MHGLPTKFKSTRSFIVRSALAYMSTYMLDHRRLFGFLNIRIHSLRLFEFYVVFILFCFSSMCSRHSWTLNMRMPQRQNAKKENCRKQISRMFKLAGKHGTYMAIVRIKKTTQSSALQLWKNAKESQTKKVEIFMSDIAVANSTNYFHFSFTCGTDVKRNFVAVTQYTTHSFPRSSFTCLLIYRSLRHCCSGSDSAHRI